MQLFRGRFDVSEKLRVGFFCLPQKPMVTRLFQCVAVCCGLLAVLAKPASGQIAIYVTGKSVV